MQQLEKKGGKLTVVEEFVVLGRQLDRERIKGVQPTTPKRMVHPRDDLRRDPGPGHSRRGLAIARRRRPRPRPRRPASFSSSSSRQPSPRTELEMRQVHGDARTRARAAAAGAAAAAGTTTAAVIGGPLLARVGQQLAGVLLGGLLLVPLVPLLPVLPHRVAAHIVLLGLVVVHERELRGVTAALAWISFGGFLVGH